MAKPKKNVDRRGFLKGAATGAAVGAAGLIAKPPVAFAQQAAQKPEATGATVEVSSNVRCGADFMVDVIKSLGIEYCAANPGTSFRGLHESVINYGNNKDPEFLTCLHEESSVAMAHGYAKIEGKPMMVMAHGTVGLQHASDGDLQRLLPTACRSTSSSATCSTSTTAAARPTGITACRTPPPWCATTSSGTTLRSRFRTSPNPPCARTRSR